MTERKWSAPVEVRTPDPVQADILEAQVWLEGERVIATATPYIIREPTTGADFTTMQAYRADPEAPSVEAVCAGLREAMEWNWLDDDPPPKSVRDRLDALLAKLDPSGETA